MGVVYKQGSTLTRSDLCVFLSNASGEAVNAALITYAIYWVDPATDTEVLIGGNSARVPENPSVGEYYASLMIPPSAAIGEYRIRWVFKEKTNSQSQTIVQEFGVVPPGTAVEPSYDGSTGKMAACEADLVHRLRTLLRDNAPDKNYHFRPPTHEGTINNYNRIFGFIWEDAELLEYLEFSLDRWNSYPPATDDQLCNISQLCQKRPAWKHALLLGAMSAALEAVAINWVADEFSYSIGGVSLDLDRSSKYQGLMNDAEDKLTKMADAKKETTKFVVGLRQSRFGMGVRSAFGPATGRNVLSPRSFF